MPHSANLIGGVSVGEMKLPQPLANLSADYNQLKLNVFLLANYKFYPQQIVSLEKTWGGVRIRHTVAEYPANIVFLTQSTQSFFNCIKQAGFLPAARVEEFPRRNGSPIYWQVVVSALVLWNIFLLVCANYSYLNLSVSTLSLPFWFVLFVSISVQRSRFVQSFFLKPNRHIEEVAPVFRFLALVSSLFAVLFVVQGLI
ncbi:hypothetical protein C7Y66_22940 [Chroococcidiopsis sp. CCALA 051]|uniref:hypothetical protein n=1 Tax=Chroococcidiopsis sp. CCALA 051 TaxID=869949 RepID=UPI000D0DBC68|nr:hypothetical protein [Chroococcidiopsis sp. CCALA 051]PSM46850.1 hypothetical protein C7Y66_22940 [Chroococcidiopsis sp. CCALA 051]